MNVEDLISLLQTFKPESLIVVGNFGGGFDNLDEVSAIVLALNVIVSPESGAHQALDWLSEDEQEQYQQVNAVCIGNIDPSLVRGPNMRNRSRASRKFKISYEPTSQ